MMQYTLKENLNSIEGRNLVDKASNIRVGITWWSRQSAGFEDFFTVFNNIFRYYIR